jgi:hypothetical protein
LEKVDDLGQDFIERHVQFSTTRLPLSLSSGPKAGWISLTVASEGAESHGS